MSDAVNHPAHYNAHPGGVECIDVVERFPFCQGNAIKYLWRADHKGARKQDLQKALWYVERALNGEYAVVAKRGDDAHLHKALRGFDDTTERAIRLIACNELEHAAVLLREMIAGAA